MPSSLHYRSPIWLVLGAWREKAGFARQHSLPHPAAGCLRRPLRLMHAYGLIATTRGSRQEDLRRPVAPTRASGTSAFAGPVRTQTPPQEHRRESKQTSDWLMATAPP